MMSDAQCGEEKELVCECCYDFEPDEDDDDED